MIEIGALIGCACWGAWQVWRDRNEPNDLIRRLDAQARRNIATRNHQHNRIEQP